MSWRGGGTGTRGEKGREKREQAGERRRGVEERNVKTQGGRETRTRKKGRERDVKDQGDNERYRRRAT